MRIATHAKADQLCINSGATCLCVLEFFDNQASRPVAEDKAIPVTVERAAGFLRRVVSRRHCTRRAKAGDGGRRGCVFGAAGEHDVGISVHNTSRSNTHAMC